MPTGVQPNPAMGKRIGTTADGTIPPKKQRHTGKMADIPLGTHNAENTPMHILSDAEIHTIIGTQEHNSPAYQRKNQQSATPPATQQSSSQAIAEQSVYEAGDKAPFLVTLQQPRINELSVSKIMFTLNLVSGVTEIKKVAANRVRVVCKDMISANKIIECPNFKQHNINAFIPNEHIKTVGIIKNVPLDFSLDEIREYIQCDATIESIERMTFWDKDARIAKPSMSLKITFRSTTLPKQVILYYTVKQVEYFIPKPLVCNKCLRFGHIARTCRSNETRCGNCSQLTHAIDASCNSTCEHCNKTCRTLCKNCPDGANHRTNSMICPEMKTQSKIKECMVKQKLSYIDAKNNYKSFATTTSYADITRSTTSNAVTTRLSSSANADTERLTNFNKQLIERLKETEDLLRIICVNNKAHTITVSPDNQSSNNVDINSLIKLHFNKYKIQMPSNLPMAINPCLNTKTATTSNNQPTVDLSKTYNNTTNVLS